MRRLEKVAYHAAKQPWLASGGFAAILCHSHEILEAVSQGGGGQGRERF